MVAKKGEYKTPFLSDSSSQENFTLSQNLESSDWERINKSLVDVVYSLKWDCILEGKCR